MLRICRSTAHEVKARDGEDKHRRRQAYERVFTRRMGRQVRMEDGIQCSTAREHPRAIQRDRHTQVVSQSIVYRFVLYSAGECIGTPLTRRRASAFKSGSLPDPVWPFLLPLRTLPQKLRMRSFSGRLTSSSHCCKEVCPSLCEGLKRHWTVRRCDLSDLDIGQACQKAFVG